MTPESSHLYALHRLYHDSVGALLHGAVLFVRLHCAGFAGEDQEATGPRSCTAYFAE